MTAPHPKTMAKALRAALAERGVQLSHAQCLELVARQWGAADWNTLASTLEPEPADRAAPGTLVMPSGWFSASHSRPELYRMGVDPDQPGVALVASHPGVAILSDSTGVLMQSFSAHDYRGGRVHLSAELSSENADRGSIWMRVDGASSQRALQFDNLMQRRDEGALTGTVDWVERSIVLDVPEHAESIHFGLLLVGTGTLRARHIRIVPADPGTATTGEPRFPPGPTNLGLAPDRPN